jgi:hypothetical protein
MTNDDDLMIRYFQTGLEHDLPDHLRREEARLEELLGTARGVSRRLPGSVRPAVMARIRSEHSQAWRRAWSWLVSPRPLRLSPVAMLGMAAAVAFLVLVSRPAGIRGPGAPVSITTGVLTRFTFEAPQASRVAITGDFANWSPEGHSLVRGNDGVWTVDIPLAPGIHHYVFVVDGSRWAADPRALWSVDDGFGNQNSVTMVAPATVPL